MPSLKNWALKKTGDYSVQFTGLKLGIHEFTFELNETFFEHFEYSEISKSQIEILVSLKKQNNLIVLDFEIRGTAEVLCDRCQENVEIDLSHEDRLFVKFGEQTSSAEGEFLVLGPNEFEIDFTQYLYEYSHLALPAKRVHKTMNACNKDVIQILEEMRVIDDEKKTDPRWDALKRLEDPE